MDTMGWGMYFNIWKTCLQSLCFEHSLERHARVHCELRISFSVILITGFESLAFISVSTLLYPSKGGLDMESIAMEPFIPMPCPVNLISSVGAFLSVFYVSKFRNFRIEGVSQALRKPFFSHNRHGKDVILLNLSQFRSRILFSVFSLKGPCPNPFV